MEVTVLEWIPEDPEIAVAWNNLVFRMERPEVFFTHQWALAASRAFADSLKPLILLICDSGRLQGVAALSTGRESRDTAFFLTASTADYCDIISEPGARQAVLAAVLAQLKNLSLRNIVLANVPAESHTLRTITTAARSNGFHLYQRPAYDCGVISLVDEEQRQAVLQSLARKGREKRGLKKLSQLGPIHITHLSGEQSEIALQSIFSAQISRFLATGRFSPLIREQRRFFLMELARLLTSAGWLRLSQMEINGIPAAWNFGFRFLDSWFWYLPTFDLQWEESSPGSCLLRLLTEEACADRSVKRLDLGLGDEAYKERFSNATVSTRSVQLSKSLSAHLSIVGRNRLVSAVGRFSSIDKRLRSGRDSVNGLKRKIRKIGLVAATKHGLTRVRRSVVFEDEIAFFKASEIEASEAESMALCPLGWQDISSVASNNASDNETLEYLVRCAKRLRQGRATGYYLHAQRNDGPSHLLWTASYDGFYLSEIDSTLEPIDPNATMIFDCWTPVSHRGHGNYTAAIRLLAAHLQSQERQVWIFSAAKNESSVRGILKGGFVYNFSMVRRKTLWHTTVSRRER